MKPETFDKLERLSALLDDSDGEIDAEIDALMGELEHDVRGLADWWGRTLRRVEARAKACQSEAAFWREKHQRYAARADRLKARIAGDMRLLGTTKVQTDLFTLAIQKSPPKMCMEQVDPAELPEWARRVEAKPDTDEIRRRLSAGEELSFAWLERGEHLRVR